jgi:hypothetical protein
MRYHSLIANGPHSTLLTNATIEAENRVSYVPNLPLQDHRMKRLLACSALVVAVLCSLYGTSLSKRRRGLSPVAAASIRNGITTKMEVAGLLGPPREVLTQVPIRQPKGAPPLEAKYTASEIWEYSNAAQASSGSPAAGAIYMVTVFFDERGIVIDCETDSK